LLGASYVVLNTYSFGLTYFSGSRWHPRHHDICSVFAAQVSGMLAIGPWHVVQPIPFAT
jgi:hypothetical protein